MVTPHYGDDGGSVCPGTGQRITVDLSYAQWHQRLKEASALASVRAVKVHLPRPRRPVPPPALKPVKAPAAP